MQDGVDLQHNGSDLQQNKAASRLTALCASEFVSRGGERGGNPPS